MTGRATGYCAGYNVPGYMNPGGGRGFGRGGRGRRNRFFATGLTGWQRAGMSYPAYGPAPKAPAGAVPPVMTRERQLEALKQQAEYFEVALNDLKKQIEELEQTS